MMHSYYSAMLYLDDLTNLMRNQTHTRSIFEGTVKSRYQGSRGIVSQGDLVSQGPKIRD